MGIDKEFVDFIIISLKCFFVLVFFGLILPRFLDYFLYNFINKPNTYDNSILVYNIVHKNLDIIYNFRNVFNTFLKQ
jgi:hypothetical protein